MGYSPLRHRNRFFLIKIYNGGWCEMKTLNPRAKLTHRMVINPEGGLVYKENSDRNLLLQSSAFKIRNSFYWTAEDTLKNLETAIDDVNDINYKLGLAYFLTNYLGIRLSPVIMTTRLAMQMDNTYINFANKNLITKIVNSIMDRPDKITNAIAYAQYSKGSGKALPPFYKRALKDAFEKFDPYTLRKFRLKRRKVKTADVIKLLHPKPKNLELSRLYKAILENSKEASIEKGTVITEVLSDTKKTAEEKTAWITTNLEGIPINATVRNMRSIDSSDKNLNILYNKLRKGLRVENGFPVVKIVNPFDILVAGTNSDAKKMAVIDKALSEFVNAIDIGLANLNVSFLVDISGSMGKYGGILSMDREEKDSGIDKVAKYMAFLLPMMKDASIKLYAFDTKVYDRTNLVELYKANSNSLINLYSLIKRDFIPRGGTALADAVRYVSNKDKPDLLIVFSDEVSWADNRGTFVTDANTAIIAINPDPQSGTVFDPTKPIIKLSSLDAKIFYYIPILANFGKFKKWIKSLV